MPSFERLQDSLMAYVARSEYEKGYAEGYTRGKDAARWQIARICALVAIIVVMFARFS